MILPLLVGAGVALALRCAGVCQHLPGVGFVLGINLDGVTTLFEPANMGASVILTLSMVTTYLAELRHARHQEAKRIEFDFSTLQSRTAFLAGLTDCAMKATGTQADRLECAQADQLRNALINEEKFCQIFKSWQALLVRPTGAWDIPWVVGLQLPIAATTLTTVSADRF